MLRCTPHVHRHTPRLWSSRVGPQGVGGGGVGTIVGTHDSADVAVNGSSEGLHVVLGNVRITEVEGVRQSVLLVAAPRVSAGCRRDMEVVEAEEGRGKMRRQAIKEDNMSR